MDRFEVGQTWGICGRHGEWQGPERCPGCAAEPKAKNRGVNVVVTNVCQQTGVVTLGTVEG